MSAAFHFQGDKTMSDLIDRYLAAVAALLPKASREDIVAELRDLILNRIEETEARLGRGLDKRETEGLLHEIGHPIAVAGRYGPRRALVGPELYPFWEFAVKTVLAIAALAAAIPAIIVLATGRGDAHTLWGLVHDFIPTALAVVGAATLVAAAVERGWIRLGDLSQWKVGDLPRLPDAPKLRLNSRFDGLFELVAILLFIGWWTHALPFPTGRDHGDALRVIRFSPIFQTLYWPILALAVTQAGSALILVVKPGWVRARAGAEIVCSLAGLALIAVLWSAQPLVVIDGPAAAEPQRTVDLSLRVALVAAAAIHAAKLILDARRLARGR